MSCPNDKNSKTKKLFLILQANQQQSIYIYNNKNSKILKKINIFFLLKLFKNKTKNDFENNTEKNKFRR